MHLIKIIIAFFSLIMSVSALPSSASLEKIHFLIPGGAGGGWDTTARGVGEALRASGKVATVSFENMSGGSGGRALAYLLETADRQADTLMISSTPILLNSLKRIIAQTYKQLTPVAAVIADYGAFVVKTDSPYRNWQQIIDDFRQNPKRIKVAGGSARGSMDHLVFAQAIKESGGNPREVRYIPYNAGAQAMVGLLSEETQVLSTGLSEAVILAKQGEVRILAMTAPHRLPVVPNVPTLVEQKVDAIFINWRGFFASPNVTETRIKEYELLFKQLYQLPQWQQIRDTRGWTDNYIAGQNFATFLQEQEEQLGLLMVELGLLN